VLISFNPFISLCKNSLIVDWRDQSLPQIRSSWTELGEQSLVCLFHFFLVFICLWFCDFHFDSRLDLGVVIIVVICGYFDCGYYYPLLHTS